MFEPGLYKNKSIKEIEEDLISQGYSPILYTEDPNDHLDTHSHPEHHILVVVDGEMKIILEGKEIVMRSGDRLTIRPHEKHAAYFGPEGCSYLWVEY